VECDQVKTRIGPFLDGELRPEEQRSLEAHLKQCRACAAAWAGLRELEERLRRSDPVTEDQEVPPFIWAGIEKRLDTTERRRRTRIYTVMRRPLAAAASLALIVGLGALITTYVAYSPPAVQAVSIDYSVLLEGADEDIERSIQRFLEPYDARPIPPTAAEDSAPSLSFRVPEMLAGGYRRDRVSHMNLGRSPGVAAIYYRGDELLMAFFHPTADNVRVSNYEEMPCIVGEHHGSEIQVGPWRLMHFMDKTTCHCVLTEVEDDSELPAMVEQIAPEVQPGVPHHHP